MNPTPPSPFHAWTRRRFCGVLPATTLSLPLLYNDLLAKELETMPRMTEGPFYPDKLPLDTDNDLIVINDADTASLGTIAYLTGRVLDRNGEPVNNATVEIWQCDAKGVYNHSRDSGRRPDKQDKNFQGFGRFLTGMKGAYNFRTIKPVVYPGRCPDIHVKVWHKGKDVLTSQILIQGDPSNKEDFLAKRLGDRMHLVEAPFVPVEASKVGSLHASFDIVLGHHAGRLSHGVVDLQISIDPTKAEMGRRAAEAGAGLVQAAIERNGHADIIVATGASQFEMLDALVEQDVDWARVTGFHLDEYIGLPRSHGASFRGYLQERFVDRVPLGAFHYVAGDAPDPAAECARLESLIGPIDVAFIGIGENAHIAFNDPPADFEAEAAYLVVDLDEACRRQQLGEGWFETLEDVPRQAISMSVPRILASESIICTVPDARKAEAVARSVNGPVTPEVPGSILQRHPDCRLFLDQASASRLQV